MKGKKLFLFLIGGTGVRVLKSLIFLLASGVKVDASEIIPIYIDADKSNGNWKEVEDILKWYRKLYEEGNFENEGNFFSTKISPLNDIQASGSSSTKTKTKNEFQIALAGTEDMKFRDYIGFSSLDSVNKDFISMLYSEEELDINMTYGFFGNPNIGSVVFQGLKNSEEFSILKNKFSQGDRFFFISSIFGGTGAAGYPTILQLLNTSDNGDISKSIKGALSVLPYFKLAENEKSGVDSNSFLTKTQAAMQYYKKAIFKESKINAQYYIGDNQETGSYENRDGGITQKNIAHFVEKASALGIIHFINTSDDNLKNGDMKHYEFGARRKSGEALTFAHLGDDFLTKVAKPLTKFFLSTVYLNNNLSKKIELAWAKNPSMGGALDSNFFSTSEFYSTNFKSFSYEFLNWIGHLHVNKIAFQPFKLGNGISGDTPYNKILENIKTLLNAGGDLLDTIEKVNKKKTGLVIKNFINGEKTFSEKLNSLVQDWQKNTNSPKKNTQKFLLLFSLASQEVIEEGTDRIVNLSVSEIKPEYFTLSTDTNGKEGWSLSSEYKDIDDPNGLASKKKLTSIPSPLARFFLQDTAFKMVLREEKKGVPDFLVAKLIAEDGRLPIYHQLVSDGLDILILLYQLKKAPNLKFVEWTTTDSLKVLLDEKKIMGRKLLGDSIQLSLKDLGESFHFNKMNGKFCILKYNNIPFGISSPLTLFYPSPNRDQVEKVFNSGTNKLRFGDDILFDKDLCHLHKREPKDFIFYLESILEFYNLKIDCENFYKYIAKNISLLEENKVLNYEEDFNEVTINSSGKWDINSSTKVYIMENLVLRAEKSGEENIKKSDFVIKATRNIIGNLPLVLQNDFDDKSMIYVSTPWDKSTRVNYHDSHPINQRHLPADGSQYPYLTVDDFLESHLIKLDYKINSNYFFNGNNEKNGYLLPLKHEFFNYFTEEDIIRKVNDKDMISIVEDGNNRVKVFLRIPVQKNKTILFEKWYSKEASPDRNLKEGGKLENFVFDLAISPLLRAPKLNNCRMIVFCDKEKQYKLYQYDTKNKALPTINDYKRTTFDLDETKFFSLDQSDLSYMRFEFTNGASAILLPKYKEHEYKQGNDSYMFAVDFGTTNTHIEYSVVGANNPKSFHKPDKEEIMVAMLHNPKDKELKTSMVTIQKTITNEFLPFEFGATTEVAYPQSEISFPQRTSLMVTPMTEPSQRDFLWDSNIPFLFGKKNISPKSEFRSNLKWGNFSSGGNGDASAIKDIEVFFDEILFMIRNRILLSSGNLKGTQLLSFYPYSMPSHMRNDLSNKWTASFKKFFPEGDDRNVNTMSESIAPFYYFKHTARAVTSGSSIAIDIGGGTSDVAIFSEKAELPDILTSFRFASKALFGDGLSKSPLPEKNGFVEAFKDEIRNLLKNDKEGLLDFMDIELDRKKRASEEWMAFFFSLDSSLEKNKQRTFMQILKEEKRFMVVYLLYYSAMIYHIAQIYKNHDMELPLPTRIFLTGMGSRSLIPVDSDGKFGPLASFTKLIFESVLENRKFKEGSKIEIISEREIAKEVTCKGGILASTNTESSKDPKAVESKKVIFTLFENEGTGKFLFHDHSKKNEKITKEDIKIVSQDVENFIKLFINLLTDKKKFKASDEFGIDVTKSIEIIKEITDHEGSILAGLGYVKNDAEIEETLFFFPIINIIHKLAFSLVQK